ncbi:MAG: VWA domain-containing protein, partial [Sphaerospermopsis kisseleviana]
MSRRLPVYLVLDCSGSMSGDPIQAVNQGVKALLAELRSEPYAIETAYLSVITFESTAQQVCPLTELITFKEPTLVAGGATSMGA